MARALALAALCVVASGTQDEASCLLQTPKIKASALAEETAKVESKAESKFNASGFTLDDCITDLFNKKCYGCGGEQCTYCRWEQSLQCCLWSKCHGCTGDQCDYCHATETPTCCASQGIPDHFNKCNAYAQCKETWPAKCHGCGGEQCTYCRWEKDLNCCYADKCKGCQGEGCRRCKSTMKPECCAQEHVPSSHFLCHMSDYDRCVANIPNACHGCGGEQCTRCDWDRALDCCFADKCTGCSGEECARCTPNNRAKCCAQEGVPSSYHRCQLTSYEQCIADVADKCRGCGGEQCSYCKWDNQLDCCYADKCKGCSGEQCAYCTNQHKAECCVREHVPLSYHKCSA